MSMTNWYILLLTIHLIHCTIKRDNEYTWLRKSNAMTLSLQVYRISENTRTTFHCIPYVASQANFRKRNKPRLGWFRNVTGRTNFRKRCRPCFGNVLTSQFRLRTPHNSLQVTPNQKYDKPRVGEFNVMILRLRVVCMFGKMCRLEPLKCYKIEYVKRLYKKDPLSWERKMIWEWV